MAGRVGPEDWSGQRGRHRASMVGPRGLVGTCPDELEQGQELTQGRTEPGAVPRHREQRAPGTRLRVIPETSLCLASPEKGQVPRLLLRDLHRLPSPSTRNLTSWGMTTWSSSLALRQDKVQKDQRQKVGSDEMGFGTE